jgi:VCBS repeat-containing protein
VTVRNAPPQADDDSYLAIEDQPLHIPAPGVLANDRDLNGDVLTVTLDIPPLHGALAFAADGAFTYTPSLNFNGADFFTYQAFDGTAASVSATITITVSAINDLPVAAGDTASAAEDTPLVAAAPGLLANDGDVDGDPLSAVLDGPPQHGILTLSADGAFVYTPTLNFYGADAFNYQAHDGLAGSARHGNAYHHAGQ